MVNSGTLTGRHCAPCNGQIPLLCAEQIVEFGRQLDEQWQVCSNSSTLERTFAFKGYAKATYLANLCAWLADREGHHPEVTFGWGYCKIVLTTHDVGGLTENDFVWAAQLDLLVQ